MNLLHVPEVHHLIVMKPRTIVPTLLAKLSTAE